MPIKIIEVKNLSVKYGGIEVLSDVSFDIDEGDYVGIIGPNGSGKTTLVRALLGLAPFEGKVVFWGKSFSEFSLRRRIGYLPQKMSSLDQRFPATAKEIVASGLFCAKKFPKRLTRQDDEAVERTMELLGIAGLRDRPIGKISGGEQQRVLLARSLVHSPEVLIFDEPTVALDPQSRDIFYEVVNQLNREKKVTAFLVSHDVATVGKYTSKLLYLDRQMIFFGTPDEFCKSPRMTGYFGAGQHIICHRH